MGMHCRLQRLGLQFGEFWRHVRWGERKCVQPRILKRRQSTKEPRWHVLQLLGTNGVGPVEALVIALAAEAVRQRPRMGMYATQNDRGGRGESREVFYAIEYGT